MHLHPVTYYRDNTYITQCKEMFQKCVSSPIVLTWNAAQA